MHRLFFFLRRALRLHPDKGGDPELFKEVTHAYVPLYRLSPSISLIIKLNRYEVLSDPDKRRVYDARGEAGLNDGGVGGMDPQVRYSTHAFPALYHSSLTYALFLGSVQSTVRRRRWVFWRWFRASIRTPKRQRSCASRPRHT